MPAGNGKTGEAAESVDPAAFDFILPSPPPAPTSKYTLGLKGTPVAGAKPTSFSFSANGTFREELGRAGFTNVTTPKDGVALPVRVNITLGTTTFTGLVNTTYKATQGKGGAAKNRAASVAPSRLESRLLFASQFPLLLLKPSLI